MIKEFKRLYEDELLVEDWCECHNCSWIGKDPEEHHLVGHLIYHILVIRRYLALQPIFKEGGE